MVIQSQDGDKAIFLGSGCMFHIVLTSRGMSERYGLLFDGEMCGGIDTYPYAILFYNSSGESFPVGFYTDKERANKALEDFILAYHDGRISRVYRF